MAIAHPVPFPVAAPQLADIFPATRAFAGVDAVRALAGFAVVCIHVAPFESTFLDHHTALTDFLDAAMWQLTLFAVPSFFAFSGFFFGRSVRARGPDAAAWSFFRRIGLFWLAWTAIYFLWPGLRDLAKDRSWDNFTTYVLFHADDVAATLWDFLVYGAEMHLWFPASLCLVMALVYAALRLGLRRGLLPVAALLFLVGLFGEGYSGVPLRTPAILPTRLAPCNGTLFFVIGFLAAHAPRLPGNLRTALVLILGGGTLQCAEAAWLSTSFHAVPGYYYMGTVPLVLGVFLAGLHWRAQSRTGSLLAAMGRVNLGVYAVHLLVLDLVMECEAALDPAWSGLPGFRLATVFAVYALSLAATLLLAETRTLRRIAI